MSADHILGLTVIVAAYGLTWYLLLISIRIVNRPDARNSETGDGTESEAGTDPEDGGNA